MQIFLFLNDLAGRWPLLDSVARLFYIGALPALGTLLLAQLLLFPRTPTGYSRSKILLALASALVLGALVTWGFDLIAAWLHLGNLSPRPWMTRRVNWLVVEPQDNSFPCIELLFASTVAAASWHLNRRFGTASWAIVALFALIRMFCGNNYFADVFVGFALGLGSFLLCLAACERHQPLNTRARQLSLNASPLLITLVGCYFFALFSPRFSSKLGLGRAATAAPSPIKLGATSTASTLTQGEGEGLDIGEGEAEELALAKRSALFLPEVEKFLTGKLTPLAKPYKLLDVEVAPVKAGTTSYRCAAVRFEVPLRQSQERRLVAERAARLVRSAFYFDSQLQNVDIVAVARDEGHNLDQSQMVFVGDEVPVFTASIQRKNLLAASPTPQPTGTPTPAPTVEALSWLRARSLVYINERVLPYEPAPTPIPTPLSTPQPSLTSSPSPLASPTIAPTKRPTLAPSASPSPKPSARPTVRPTPRQSSAPRPTLKPTGNTPRPIITPSALTARKTPLPTPTAQTTAKPSRTSQPTSGVIPTPPLTR